MQTLEELRKEIDAIDEQLLQLIAKRMLVVVEVGALKKAHNIAPLDEKRWQEVLDSKIMLARKLNLSEDFIRGIYNQIHEQALDVEKKV